MTNEEEREYCLNKCPFPNGCSSRCEIFNRGQRGSQKKYVPKTDRKRPQSDFQQRKEKGMEMLMAGIGKTEIVRELDVSYSSVQRWEVQLIREGKFRKPEDLRKERKNG